MQAANDSKYQILNQNYINYVERGNKNIIKILTRFLEHLNTASFIPPKIISFNLSSSDIKKYFEVRIFGRILGIGTKA